MRVRPDRVAKLIDRMDAIMTANSMPPSVRASITGKLQWTLSWVFGKFGWGPAAMITPLVLLATGVAFFGLCAARGTAAGGEGRPRERRGRRRRGAERRAAKSTRVRARLIELDSSGLLSRARCSTSVFLPRTLGLNQHRPRNRGLQGYFFDKNLNSQ